MTELESYLDGVQRFGIKPGLERIRALLELAGAPQLRYPIVLVGGTNGKGSTCEFLTRLLTARRSPVGLYTSPHLYHWNERLRVLTPSILDESESSGEKTLFPGSIEDEALDRLFQDALPYLETVAREHGQPTEFETLTFLGLWHFARAGAASAVIEVGLGGRWDATNVTDPQVSVVTHVALDHCDRLGNTVEEIARDKIDIARSGRVLVTAETKPNVLEVFREECAVRGALLWPFRAPDYSNDRDNMESCRALVETALRQFESANPFQHINFETAAFARLTLEKTLAPENSSFSATLPEAAIKQVEEVVPGRMEIVRTRPTVILDSANNPDGAEHLAHFLQKQLAALPDARLILVAGILADKDYDGMLAALAPLAATVIVTQSHSARATLVDTLAVTARHYALSVETATPVMAAVQRAMEIAAPQDIVCIAGSFYTISEVDRAELLTL